MCPVIGGTELVPEDSALDCSGGKGSHGEGGKVAVCAMVHAASSDAGGLAQSRYTLRSCGHHGR
jgi:hypothetical protein